MTNREWVTLHVLWKAVSSHPFLWPTVCGWNCTFVKGNLITSFLMTNSMWVPLHICKRQSCHMFSYDQQHVSDIAHLWKAVSPHFFLWPTACEWHCTFDESQSHHMFSYDQQEVSDMLHFVKASLITSFYMTNRMSVTLHILWKSVSMTVITSFPATNRMWVTMRILWKAVSSMANR